MNITDIKGNILNIQPNDFDMIQAMIRFGNEIEKIEFDLTNLYNYLNNKKYNKYNLAKELDYLCCNNVNLIINSDVLNELIYIFENIFDKLTEEELIKININLYKNKKIYKYNNIKLFEIKHLESMYGVYPDNKLKKYNSKNKKICIPKINFHWWIDYEYDYDINYDYDEYGVLENYYTHNHHIQYTIITINNNKSLLYPFLYSFDFDKLFKYYRREKDNDDYYLYFMVINMNTNIISLLPYINHDYIIIVKKSGTIICGNNTKYLELIIDKSVNYINIINSCKLKRIKIVKLFVDTSANSISDSTFNFHGVYYSNLIKPKDKSKNELGNKKISFEIKNNKNKVKMEFKNKFLDKINIIGEKVNIITK